MKINWLIRLRNKNFWLAMIPAVCLLVQQILALSGVDWEYDTLAVQLAAIVGAVFSVLTLLGVVSDPTTPGLSDSERALHYCRPGVPGKNEQKNDSSKAEK
jgi:phi LC3 family holin